MFNVFIPFGKESWISRVGKPSQQVSADGLLETYRGQTASGSYVTGIAPTDEFCDWLLAYCPSWATSEDHSPREGIFSPCRTKGVLLGFLEAKDAVLTKLTWGGE